MKLACSGCRFWKPGDEGFGECLRHSPLPRYEVPEDDTESVASRFILWPVTLDTEWCGEWEESL